MSGTIQNLALNLLNLVLAAGILSGFTGPVLNVCQAKQGNVVTLERDNIQLKAEVHSA